MFRILCIQLLVLLQLQLSFGQQSVSKEISGCAGKSVTLDCTSSNPGYNNTVILEEVIYGLRSDPSKDCGFSSGDCFAEKTDKYCSVVNQKCTLPVYTTINLPCFGAEKKADYMRAQYTCVPNMLANGQNTYDICESGDINSNFGIIQSPNYPKYTQAATPCIRKLVAPAGKSFNIWVLELNLKKADSNGCSDYIRVSDSTGIKDVCGMVATSFVRQFCAKEIYVSYKAASPQTPLIATYKGFKLYFEVFDEGLNPGCPTDPAVIPTEIATQPPTTQPPPPLGDTQATPPEEFKLCKGESRNFVAPTPYHVFYLEEFVYGVSASDPQSTCPNFDSTDCINPTPSQCSMKTKCSISFVNNIALNNCAKQNAQYLFGIFRYIPIQSTSTAVVCQDTNINADTKPRGVITSSGYPTFQQNQNCKLTLSVSDPTKTFRIYITDIYVDPSNLLTGECQQSYVRVSDQGSSQTYCNVITSSRIFAFAGCSNTATIEYKSSSATFAFYVGFRAYYEVVNKEFACSDSQTTTTTKAPTTTTTTNLPLFSPIITTDNQKCTTPFVYKQQSYENCINADNSAYWCSVSGNADTDGKKTNCKLGLTQNVQYNICARSQKRLSCPKNYVIFVFSSDYAITEDGTCDGKIICTGSDNNYVKNTCAGKNECSLTPAAVTVFSCQNKVANMLQLDYACVPDNVEGFKSYDVCGADSVFENKGFIKSPNFPSSVSNRDCQNKVISFGSRIQFISVYSVSIDVGTSAILGTKCQNSYLTVNDGDKLCGSVKTSLLYEGCSNMFKVSMNVGSETKGFKLYYEVVDDASLCSQQTTTTGPTTTTTAPVTAPPAWVNQGIASPTKFEHLCAGANAVQTLNCPNNYVISFRNKYYGVSSFGGCFYFIGDCVAYVDSPADNCAGSQSCTINYNPIPLLNCENRQSSYLRLEYECIPVSMPTQNMCDRTFNAKNGIISSPNYPQYKTGVDCSTQITVSEGKSIKIHIVNMAMNPDCSKDSLEFIDPQIANSIKICGDEKTYMVTETCTNTLNIRLRTGDVTSSSYRGVQIYYEEIPKVALNFQCTAPTTTKVTSPGTPVQTTTTTTTRPAPPSYNGFASQTMSYVSCANISIECPLDYVLVFKESAYGVSAAGQCSYNPNDCFGKYAFPITLCSGAQKCNVNVKPSLSLVGVCGNKYANYIYLQYQCLPKISAGNPLKEQMEICGAGAPTTIAANSAALYKSPNYPSYPTDQKSCLQNISVPAGSTIMAYALDLNFQGSQINNCNETTNYLTVFDGAERASYCGSLNYATFIFQSRSNWISFQYLLKNTVTSNRNRGFLLYLEAYTSTVTANPVTESPTPPPTRTTVNLNGLASPIRHEEVCVYTQKDLYCSNKYVLVIYNELLLSTGTGCSHSNSQCSQPSQVVSNACAGKTDCLLYLAPTPIQQCGSRVADMIDFEFQCIPTEPAGGSRVYTCDSPSIDKVKNGFIISPGFPAYTPNVKNCEVKITPNANEGIKLYLIDLAVAQPTDSGCVNGLEIDGQQSLCGSDNARELLVTQSSRPVTIKYNSLNIPEAGLRGFKLYFETYSLSDVVTSTTTTRVPRTKIDEKKGHNGALIGVSLGLGIPLCIVLIGLIWYFRRLNMGDVPQIRFSSKNNESKINEDIRSFANPNATL